MADTKNTETVIPSTPIPSQPSDTFYYTPPPDKTSLRALIAIIIILLNILSNVIIFSTPIDFTRDGIYSTFLFISGIIVAICCIVVGNSEMKGKKQSVRAFGMFVTILFAIGFFLFNMLTSIGVAIRGYPD